MKWIPAVMFLAMFNCEQGQTDQPAAPAADAGGGTNSAKAKADAEAAAKPAENPDSALQFTNPFLYRVTKAGNHRESYIFGTINAKFDMDFDRAPISVRQAMTASSHAMFEVATGSAAQRERTKLMAMTDGSVRKELGRDRFKQLVELTQEQSGVLDVMNPWVIYMTLEEKLSGDAPMDELFEGFAQSYRKRLVYLETPTEQVNVVANILDWNALGKMVDSFDAHSKSAAVIADAYAKGEDGPIAAALFPPDDARGEFYKKLLDARVESWSGKLDQQFSTDATFAVVSMRYLVGPTSIIKAMEAKGWKLERVAK